MKKIFLSLILMSSVSYAGFNAISAAGGGGIGGSTGSTDKAVLTANGTGGATVQASTVTIGATGAISNVLTGDVVGLKLQKSAGASSNLTEWYDSTPTLQAWMKNNGIIEASSFRIATDLAGFTNDQWLNPTYATNMNWGSGAGTSAWQLAGRNTTQAFKSMFEIQQNKAGNIGMIIQPFTGTTPTVDNLEVNKEDGTVLYRINKTGNPVLQGFANGSFPTATNVGEEFYNTTDNWPCYWNGSAWKKFDGTTVCH